MKFHAPGLGLEVEGRDIVNQHIREFVEQADVRYDVEDVVEHGPFTVAFTRSSGTLDGQRMTWQLCQVLRYEREQIVETWSSAAASRSRSERASWSRATGPRQRADLLQERDEVDRLDRFACGLHLLRCLPA